MVFEFFLKREERELRGEWLSVGTQQVPLLLVRNQRARRYVLRLRPDGTARVTVPRGGSDAEARRFAIRNRHWIERQLGKIRERPQHPEPWTIGTGILFRGDTVNIEMGTNGESGAIRFGGEVIRLKNPESGLRSEIERHLWELAGKEFPPVVREFAARHGLSVRRISVRNQRSRWGSCSRKGTISLNWRLIQAPLFVRDYLIFHELAHLREMNHSSRFWREVERICPEYRKAEQWLHEHGALLRRD